MIRGRLRPLTKNAVNGTYALVLPIDGIFAECSTRRPSDAKLPRTATHSHARLRTTENACVFHRSRSLAVSSSRRPVVSQSRSLVVPQSRGLIGAPPSHSQSFPVILSHSQSFPVIPRRSQPFSVNCAPTHSFSVNRAPSHSLSFSCHEITPSGSAKISLALLLYNISQKASLYVACSDDMTSFVVFL